MPHTVADFPLESVISRLPSHIALAQTIRHYLTSYLHLSGALKRLRFVTKCMGRDLALCDRSLQHFVKSRFPTW
jgi:hypothetical protein